MRILTLCCVLAACTTVFAQNLPKEMYLSDDGHMLMTGGKPSTGLYDSATIRTIYLEFPQSNYWNLLTQNYASHTRIPATMIVDGETYDSVGVRFRGQTSYSMLPQSSQKKSFDIDLEFVHEGQDIKGYNDLNLMNSFQDESFLRDVFYKHQIRRHIPTAKANFVQLYLNGQSWGLYPNVQQQNKDYLEEWFLSNDGAHWRADRPTGSGGGGPGGGGPGFGNGTAALNYLGADTALYQQYYTLKSSDIDDPWSLLVATCNALNNTPSAQLTSVLPQYLDIDRTLWFLATEVAFSDDDSYIFKGAMDYYVYYEPETGRITPLEYDGNSVMAPNASSWSPFYNQTNVNFPLLNKILAVPEWRQRYLAHLRTVIADELNPAECNAILDNLHNQIDSLVQADPKKLYTYPQFISEITGLKTFIANRRTFLLSNTEVAQVAPSIANAEYRNAQGEAWTAPLDGEAVNVTATISSTNGISRATLYYTTGLVGNFSSTQMFDDGQHNDGAAGDGVFGGEIPGFGAGAWVRFYIEAVANNTAKSVSYLPVGAEHDVFVYIVAPLAGGGGPVVINEIMADNATTAADENGTYEDWIELYNNSSSSIDLSGYFMTDNPANLTKWEFPQGSVIAGNGYLVIWADEDSSDGANHCNFKLSASGEVIMLLNPNQILIDEVTFGEQQEDMGYARVPNGTGSFVIQAPTFGTNNNLVNGIDDPVEMASAIRLYPNPASDWVNVAIDNFVPQQALVVYDAAGREVTRWIPESPLETMRTLLIQAPGFYAIRYGNYTASLIVTK